MASKAELTRTNSLLRSRASEADDKLDDVRNWQRDMLNRHKPYISGRIDVSVSKPEEMRAELLERIGRNIYCNECSTPFPCREVVNLRQLWYILNYGTEYEGLPTPDKPEQPGSFDAAL